MAVAAGVLTDASAFPTASGFNPMISVMASPGGRRTRSSLPG